MILTYNKRNKHMIKTLKDLVTRTRGTKILSYDEFCMLEKSIRFLESNITENFLLEDIINYCRDTCTEFGDAIEAHIADYFDFKNRLVEVQDYELEWIKKNISRKEQKKIFGKVIC